MSRRTTNKKLTKLYWPSRKCSPKRLIVRLEPKNGGSRPKKISRHFAPGAPLPPLSRRTGVLPLWIRSSATAANKLFLACDEGLQPTWTVSASYINGEHEDYWVRLLRDLIWGKLLTHVKGHFITINKGKTQSKTAGLIKTTNFIYTDGLTKIIGLLLYLNTS